MKAKIRVTLKSDVLDPQGKAIQSACASLGYDSIQDVRQGKYFEVTLDAADTAAARPLLDELCQKLLSNPIIEDYEVLELGD